jgi:cellulose 1,4-beta-cellobiosidase
MKSTLALAALAAGAHAAPSRITPRAACSTAVTLSGNPFSGRTLHANSYYRAEVEAAVKNLSDSSLATAAAKVADVGSFLWLDTIEHANTLLDSTLAEIPCGEIGGFVIYDLPGRDCAALASNGELATGQLAKYKSDYIDRMSSLLQLRPLPSPGPPLAFR